MSTHLYLFQYNSYQLQWDGKGNILKTTTNYIVIDSIIWEKCEKISWFYALLMLKILLTNP